MSKGAYRDPQIRLNRIYTKSGDLGETRLVNGRKVPKDDPRIEAYGSVDELNSFVGLARLTAEDLIGEHPALGPLIEILFRVQHELFNLGSILATDPSDIHPRQPRVGEADIRKLEAEIDEMNAELPALPSFVLPGGHRLCAELHVCRTVCRRVERLTVALSREEEVPAAVSQYLNRLSDAFFVWSRWVCVRLGAREDLWTPNRASSGQPSGGTSD